MANHWVILLFIGYAIAAPWPLPEILEELSDQEKREMKLREILNDPAAPSNDKIGAINEEADVQAFEQDIKLTPQQEQEIDMSSTGDEDGKFVDGNLKRSTTHLGVHYVWTTRKIPYVLDSSIDTATANVFRQAVSLVHSKSCVRWVERTKEPYYVLIKVASGCWSYIGNVRSDKGYQELSIGSGCAHVGIILHEMLHAMGFWHEQSRPDRNSKVEIMWENIVSGKESNFNKQGSDVVSLQDTSYDLGSLMQYGNYAFSKNGKMTIQSIKNAAEIFGQRNGFSDSDVLALNRMYSCNVTNGGWSYWSEYGPCDSTCYKTRNRFCTNSESSAACDASLPTGKQTEKKLCPDSECYAPVDGHWGRWSAWTSCSKTCDWGTKTRTRSCDDPAPKHKGATCPGSNTGSSNCKNADCGAGPLDCSFDDPTAPLCSWQQDVNDVKKTYKDWMVGSSTPSGGTGPQKGDHTTGTGKFAYSEASDCIHTTGNYVRLISKIVTPTGSNGYCFKFWYCANGATMGAFNVFVKTSSAQTKIGGFPAYNNQGDSWKEAKYHFTPNGDFKLILESQCGADYRADFAIDDTKLIAGPCPA